MNGPLLLDGGTGSELRRRGVPFQETCWSAAANLDYPDVLIAIHGDYIAAGADIVTANTFATARFVLEAAGLGDRFETINRSAIAAARQAASAAGRTVRVAASLSCCPPLLDMSAWPAPAVELAHYRELAGLFADASVDLVLLEMLQHAEHAALACRAAREAGLPFWAGISCRIGQLSDGATSSGELVSFDAPRERLERIVDAILPFEPDGIAIMHSPVEAVAPALAVLSRRWQGPVGAWAEIPYDEDPAVASAERVSPAGYASLARHWLEQGVRLIGGCCGTTPAHIASLRRLLDETTADG